MPGLGPGGRGFKSPLPDHRGSPPGDTGFVTELPQRHQVGGDRHLVEDRHDRSNADARSGRHVEAPVAQLERRRDVTVEVTRRRRRVPRQGEARQRRECQVGRATNSCFEHSSAPHRYAPVNAQIVDSLRLEVAADTTRLDIDDAARTDVEGTARHLERRDRLVETHRRAHRTGQLDVPDDVLLGKWLLDEQQIEFVETCEMCGIVDRIRGVGVNLEHEVVTELAAHRTNGLDVVTGFDFQFDAHVPVVEISAHDAQQRIDRRLDSDRHTAHHA